MARFLLATFLVLGLVSVGHAAESRDAFAVGGWKGEAVYGEKGDFAACTARAPYRGGVLFNYTLYANGTLAIHLFRQSWTLPEGEEFSVRLGIDGNDIGRFPAVALGTHMVLIPLGPAEEYLKALRHGKVLQIRTRKTTLAYRLTNTLEMLPRLVSCVKQRTGPQNNPFGPPNGGSGTNPFGGETRPDTSGNGLEEVKAGIRGMLTDAGVAADSIDFMEEKGVRHGGLEPALAWSAGPLGGFLYVEKPEGPKPSRSLLQRIQGAYGERCGGTFRTSVEPAGKGRIRGTTVCEEGSTTTRAGIVVNQTPEMVVAVAHRGTNRTRKRLEAVTDRFWQGILQSDARGSGTTM